MHGFSDARMNEATAATVAAAPSPIPAGATSCSAPQNDVWAGFNRRVQIPRPLSLQPEGGENVEPWLRIAERAPARPTPAAVAQALASLNSRYLLSQAQVDAFRRDHYIRLKAIR